MWKLNPRKRLITSTIQAKHSHRQKMFLFCVFNSLNFTKYSSKIENLQTKMKGCSVSYLLSLLKAVSEIRLNEVWSISERTVIFNNHNH